MTATALQNMDLSKLKAVFHSFWTWWAGELKALLPKPLGQFFSQDKTILEIDFGPNGVGLKYHAGAGPFVKIKAPPHATPDLITAFLDKTYVFKKEISLPLAQKKSLRHILPLQLDRHFPLSGNNVYFAFQSGVEDKAKQTLSITLYILQPGITDQVFSYLKQKKIASRRVLFLYREGAREIAFEVPVPKTLKAKIPLGNLIKNPLFISAGLWLLVFFTYPFYLQIKTAHLREKVNEIQAVFSGTASAMAEYEAQVQKESYLTTYLERPNILAVLNGLAEALPGEAWVEDFSFKNVDVILTGFHPEPSAIVPILENATLFREVQLPSVTENPDDPQSDCFRITMKIELAGEDQ